MDFSTELGQKGKQIGRKGRELGQIGRGYRTKRENLLAYY